MISKTKISRQEIIQETISCAVDKKASQSLLSFISLMYQTVPLDKLKQIKPEFLYDFSVKAWPLIKSYNGSDSCEIFKANDLKYAYKADNNFIFIATKSKPFLIDSIRMALIRHGANIYHYIHIANIKITKSSKYIEEIRQDSSENYTDNTFIVFEINNLNKTSADDLRNKILNVLDDVSRAVRDWGAMKGQMQKSIEVIDKLSANHFGVDNINESKFFLTWLIEYFTFLGCREYIVQGAGKNKALVLKKNSSLGVLREHSNCIKQRYYCDLPKEIKEHALSKKIMLVTKTNTQSSVHRPAYTDMIICKSFDDDGQLIGEKRFVGLFTSDAYDSDPSKIPFLKQKVDAILNKATTYSNQYDRKRLLHILKRLPRDDLFQASLDDLYAISIGVLDLQERRVIKLFARKDICNRFISCLVYVPKDNYSTQLRINIQKILIESFNGTEITSTPTFSESSLASVHFIIRTESGDFSCFDLEAIEQKIIDLAMSWLDYFELELVSRAGDDFFQLYEKYKMSFSADFMSIYSGQEGADAAIIADSLNSNKKIHVELTKNDANYIVLKIYQNKSLLPLSDAIPILENIGMRVIGERVFEIKCPNNDIVYISEFIVEHVNLTTNLSEKIKEIFLESLMKIWQGDLENDRFNSLSLRAGLNWNEIRIIRAYARYLKQIRFSLSQSYIQDTFEKYPFLAKDIVSMFVARFDPEKVSRNKFILTKRETNKKLKDLDGVDQERIVKAYVELISATVRVNIFKNDQRSSCMAMKIESSKISILPLPKPLYEIFVFSDKVEGIHLRAGKVSRGGIRWSDRTDDFRTEILGLMKAQNGKNSLIVPAGSKGGFIAKKININMSREDVDKEVIGCYKQFITSLLDITDNLVKNTIIKPDRVICYDDDDPYLVVAADRGTASFSDTANQLSADYGFWLMDAFASGGSAGYDHKKMGITAKGAWQSVEWHFKSINQSMNKTFSVIGIGGMAGDVFGNGMLLSNKVKLIAAFDHSFIFIDPNPSPEKSFNERRKLFNIKNVNWSDYDTSIISSGGGVYSRKDKYIEISAEAKKSLNLNKNKFSPNELIHQLLSVKVDLLWNGGIGTYVKSSKENNMQVGDHANDSLRVNGASLNCKIVAEGGNLGLTQLGRIEFESAGGVVNTDFIDNSAGVDCSDHEVNIKIFLNRYVNESKLSYINRNKLLVNMTSDVAKMVLIHTVHQNVFLSIEMLSLPKYIYLYEKFIEIAAQTGVLDPDVEYLPSKQTVLNRLSAGGSLTRPEMAVLFSYSKIILQTQILKTNIIDNKNNIDFLCCSFPKLMLDEIKTDGLLKGADIWDHPLRREIIATHLSNTFIHHMGISFIVELQEETNKKIVEIVNAYIVARNIFNIKKIMNDLDADYQKLSADDVFYVHKTIRRLLRRSVKWLLRNDLYDLNEAGREDDMEGFKKKVNKLMANMPLIATGEVFEAYKKMLSRLKKCSLNNELACSVADLNFSYASLNIIQAVGKLDNDTKCFAQIYFMISEKTGVYWLKKLISELNVETKWDIAAIYSLKGKLDEVQRLIATNAFQSMGQNNNIDHNFALWFDNNKLHIKSWLETIAGLSKRKKAGFTVVFSLINELGRIANLLK